MFDENVDVIVLWCLESLIDWIDILGGYMTSRVAVDLGAHFRAVVIASGDSLFFLFLFLWCSDFEHAHLFEFKTCHSYADP